MALFVDKLEGLRAAIVRIKSTYGSGYDSSAGMDVGTVIGLFDRMEDVLLAALDVFVDVVVNGKPYPPDKLTGVFDIDHVDLEWVAALGDVDNQRIYKDDDGGGFAAIVPDVGAGDTTYVDNVVVSGHVYSYYVVGVNVNGESDVSNTVIVSAP